MVDANEKKVVLFLCTGNSCRSQMAEAYLSLIGRNKYKVLSAGLEPKGVHPIAVKVMKEDGLDISNNESTDLKEYLGHTHIDTVITVCSNADQRCPHVWPGLSERLHWPFEDPAAFEGSEEETLEKFREIRDQIRGQISEWISEGAA